MSFQFAKKHNIHIPFKDLLLLQFLPPIFFLFYIQFFFLVKYGNPKSYSPKTKTNINDASQILELYPLI